ncbi:MAG: hypothetical protein GY768_08425 [Planctomycetaceae bacterium]|nr:hypothetical protein [Planctomycetaceae bacterium]
MQFSLKTMMIATCIVAVICALKLSLSFALVGFVVLILKVLVPSALVTGMVYGDSGQRIFSMGASAAFLTIILTERSGWLSVEATRMVMIPVAVCLGGWFALKTRVWLASRSTPSVEAPPVAPSGSTEQKIDP